MRIELEAEILKAKSELEMQLEENTAVQVRNSEEVKRLDDDYRLKNEEMKNMEAHLRKDIEILRDENDNVNRALEARQSDLQRERKEAEDNDQIFKEKVSSLEDKVTNFKDDLERITRKSGSVTFSLILGTRGSEEDF